MLGGAFGGYANDRIAHLAQEAYPAQEPPPFFGGERSAQARKKASEGHPQKVVTVVIVVTFVGFCLLKVVTGHVFVVTTFGVAQGGVVTTFGVAQGVW